MLNSGSNSGDGLHEQRAGLLATSCLPASPLRVLLQTACRPCERSCSVGPVSLAEGCGGRDAGAAQAAALEGQRGTRLLSVQLGGVGVPALLRPSRRPVPTPALSFLICT